MITSYNYTAITKRGPTVITNLNHKQETSKIDTRRFNRMCFITFLDDFKCNSVPQDWQGCDPMRADIALGREFLRNITGHAY